MSTTKITQVHISSRMEQAYGAFMGAAVGDAAGATLEFFRKGITEEIALNAMTMPGGGQLQVGKGQFTDDTECAIEGLAFGLYDKDPALGFPVEDVAQGYSKWYHSRPFDMGGTCSKAFSTDHKQEGLLSNRMMKNAAKLSIVSEANGALMRCCPIAIWSVGEDISVIAHNAKLDAMLSHPSQVCQDCNVIVVLAIEYLIRNPGDFNGAIDYLDNYVTFNIHTNKVRDWYFKDSLDISELDCSKQIGWVKWGFVMAIYYLRNNTPYEIAIKEVLMKGGDTDTNAAICGSVLGALGINGIPKYMLEPVLAFDPTNPDKGHKRPAKYSASNIYGLTYQLLTHEIAKKR